VPVGCGDHRKVPGGIKFFAHPKKERRDIDTPLRYVVGCQPSHFGGKRFDVRSQFERLQHKLRSIEKQQTWFSHVRFSAMMF